MTDFSRREACRTLGLMGLAILTGGCQRRAPFETLFQQDTAAKDGVSGAPPLTPEQFEALVGTVHETRVKAAGAPEAAADFIRRFVSFSPRVLEAKRAGGVIGSVFVDPTPKAIELAVNLQMARERLEPAVLHDDIGLVAGRQYWRHRRRYFVMIVPNTVNLFGESLHRDRYLQQVTAAGELPSEKIVQTNQDLESLIGRQLTFARLMVNGLQYSASAPPIRRADVWIDDQEGNPIPDRMIGVSLLSDLVRLEMAGAEVRAITPDAGASAAGWQDVSEPYRNFALGQLIEAEGIVSKYQPRNAFEDAVSDGLLAQYHAYLIELKKRLNWGDARNELYESQKHSKVDLMTQQIFLDV